MPDSQVDTIKIVDESTTRFERVELPTNVTVAMSAYGNYRTTLLALRSLFLAASGDFELLLVDDCSPENDVRALFRRARAEHANTKLFFSRQNREYSGSLNAILSHARGQWVLFLSNDIFVTPHYLREMLALAGTHPDFGIVRGCSNFVDNGKVTHNLNYSRELASYGDLFEVGERVAHDFAGQHLVDDFLTGDAFLVSRAVLDKIGTFDPLFYGYFADHDFGLRAQIAGFKMALARGAFAFHQRDANFGYLPEQQRNEKLNRRWARVYENWARFKLKYGLPVELMYASIGDIPWTQLAAPAFDPAVHYIAPKDYSADIVTTVG